MPHLIAYDILNYMRRSKQQISSQTEINDIISKSMTARLGLNRDGAPYIIPMNFGYNDNTFYFHSADSGLKLELLRNDPRVCIEIDESSALVKDDEEKPCSWGVKYRSVIVTGKAEILTNHEEKSAGLEIILSHFVGNAIPPMTDERIKATTVFRVPVDTLSAKKSK